MNYEKINEQPKTKLCLDSNFNSNKTIGPYLLSILLIIFRKNYWKRNFWKS